jgi:hypothetical protein
MLLLWGYNTKTQVILSKNSEFRGRLTGAISPHQDIMRVTTSKLRQSHVSQQLTESYS